MPYFGSSPSGEAAKTGVIYKKPICSSVNRGMYGQVTGRMGEGGGEGGLCPQYVPRLRTTKEHIPLYSSIRCNRGIYVYIPQYRRIYGHIFIEVIFLVYFIS
jgi:hypothetical protein